MNFKKGDHVKAIEVYGTDEKCGLRKGDCGIVQRDNGMSVYYVKFSKKLVRQPGITNLEADGTYQMYASQLELVEVSPIILIRQSECETIAKIKQGKTVIKSAKATCNTTDTYDFETGAKLAFRRLMGEEVKTDKPYIEVKRPAKVGEWIKIVAAYHLNAFVGNSEYKNGDVLRVERIDGGEYYVDGISEYVQQSEYVVLENYQPESKPFVKAKVGDKIKVVKVNDYHTPIVSNGDEFIVEGIQDSMVHTSKNSFYDSDEEYIIIEEAKKEKTLADYTSKEIVEELLRRYSE